jgi:hypothetical protein
MNVNDMNSVLSTTLDMSTFTSMFTHSCCYCIRPNVRWFKVPGKEAMLQQAWICQGCGNMKWEDVPVEVQW